MRDGRGDERRDKGRERRLVLGRRDRVREEKGKER